MFWSCSTYPTMATTVSAISRRELGQSGLGFGVLEKQEMLCNLGTRSGSESWRRTMVLEKELVVRRQATTCVPGTCHFGDDEDKTALSAKPVMISGRQLHDAPVEQTDMEIRACVVVCKSVVRLHVQHMQIQGARGKPGDRWRRHQ